MVRKTREVLREALALPPKARAEIASTLLHSLDVGGGPKRRGDLGSGDRAEVARRRVRQSEVGTLGEGPAGASGRPEACPQESVGESTGRRAVRRSPGWGTYGGSGNTAQNNEAGHSTASPPAPEAAGGIYKSRIDQRRSTHNVYPDGFNVSSRSDLRHSGIPLRTQEGLRWLEHLAN